jgi:hypothetical protein
VTEWRDWDFRFSPERSAHRLYPYQGVFILFKNSLKVKAIWSIFKAILMNFIYKSHFMVDAEWDALLANATSLHELGF